MRFQQPVGVLPPSNDFLNVINVNLISSENKNRINGNNFANVTEGLKKLKNLTSSNSFDLPLNKTTTLEDILQLTPDSRYFKNYFDSQQTDRNNVDLKNGNNDIVFIETLNFTADNLSEVSTKCAINFSLNLRAHKILIYFYWRE